MGDLILKFRGQEYALPENRAFEAGEVVEEIATLPEVMSWAKAPRFHKLARCFAALLNCAGARVTPKEVHSEMMAGFAKGDPGEHLVALMALVNVLMDGAPKGDGDAPEKTPAAS